MNKYTTDSDWFILTEHARAKINFKRKNLTEAIHHEKNKKDSPLLADLGLTFEKNLALSKDYGFFHSKIRLVDYLNNE